jgi:hypothetical protein
MELGPDCQSASEIQNRARQSPLAPFCSSFVTFPITYSKFFKEKFYGR